MNVVIKHKGNEDVLCTVGNVIAVYISGGFLQLESTRAILIGTYNLLDFDFEIDGGV